MLSHRGAPNPQVLGSRHAKLRALLPHLHIPSASEEAADFGAAILTYNACVVHLAGITRTDKVKYHLLCEENCNYGFARNLWTLKAIGLFIALAGSTILGGALAIQFQAHGHVEPVTVAFEVLNALWVVGWVGVVSPQLVRHSADRYAERLLEAMDTL
jgi:hypothetical protein